MIANITSIPLVSSNLRPEEAYIDILDALRHVEKVCDDVFARIDQKNAEQHRRIKAINDRLALAESKVAALRGSKKAIRVFASPTFPENGRSDEFKSIFLGSASEVVETINGLTPIKSKFHRETKPVKKLEVLPLIAAVRDAGLNFDESLQQGLGKLPVNLQSVSSLLLFNTDQNPYSKSSSSHEGRSKIRKLPEPEPQIPTLDAAPPSFIQSEGGRPKDDLSYIPGFGDVPEFDLPNILPDLQGIADFSEDLDMNFGASIPIMGSFTLEPPEVSGPPSTLLPPVTTVPTPVAPSVANLLPVIPGAPAPPPPPPPVAVPAPPKTPAGPSNPPPPPPPAYLPVTPDVASVAPAKPLVSADGRASLLESIRAAGGAGKAGLKSIKERKLEQKKKKQEEKATVSAGGGDLMGDLKKRLTNMRKGISEGKMGTTDGTATHAPAQKFGSAMDQVNKLIPHSPTPLVIPEKVTDDGDWSD